MDLVLTLDDATADELRDLHRALAAEQDLRGRVSLRHRPPEPGHLGPVVEAVEVALAPGGALTVVAGAVLVWLRHRRGTVKVKLTKGHNTVELTAHRIRDLDPAVLSKLTAELATTLDPDQKP